MKPSRVLCFLLAFLIVPIAITPNAAALTWSSVLIDSDADPTDNTAITEDDIQVETFGSTSHVFYFAYPPTNDLLHKKSTDNGATWSSSHIVTTALTSGQFDMKVIDADNIVGCYVDSGGNILFVGSSTGGNTWFGPVTVHVPGDADGCAIIAWSTTILTIITEEDVGTNVVSRRSTDGGSTWATVNVDITQSFDLQVEADNKNSTDALLLFQQNTSGDVSACRTTDAGLTWSACADVGAQDVSGTNSFDLHHISADRYDFAHADGSGNIFWCTTSNAFVGPPTCSTVATTQTGTDSVSFEVDPSNTDLVGVFWGQAASTTSLRFSQSTDLGGAWSAHESVKTFVASTSHGYVDSTVLPNGSIGVVHQDCFDGATQVDCSSATTDAIDTYIETAAFGGSEEIVAEATASVTDLVGFDVDPTGSIAIARTSLGENVLTFNAQTLGTSVSGTIDTNCAVGTNDYEDGVMARSLDSGGDAQLVGFLNCDAGGDAQYLSIRQVDGSVPTLDQFNDCEPVDAGGVGCHYNIDLTDFDEPIDSGLGQLGQVKDFPVDYSNQGSFLGSIVGRTAWAFASQQCDDPPGPTYCTGTEPGYVGVATYTARAVDPANTDSVQHHPDQDVHDFCLGLDGSNYYLASVVTGQPGHTWSVTFSETDGDALDSSISNSPSSFGSSAYAVGCGGGQILFVNGDNSLQLLSRTGTFIDSIPGVDAETRGVSLSEEFVGPTGAVADRGTSCTTALEDTGDCLQFGVYVDGLEGVIVNATGGSLVEVGRLTLPSGSFHSIRMDRLAQNIWVATSTTIARFEVFTVTTEDPVNIPGDEDDGDALPGDGLFEGSGATVGAAFGVGAFGGNLFLGAVLMGIVAYGVGIGYGNTIDSQSMQPRALRVNPWAAAVGAAMGFLLAWGFGFFSTAVVFSLIALVAMIVGIRLWVSRG